MTEEILAVELTDLDKQKRVSVVSDQRLLVGAFGNSYAKSIVENISQGMEVEQATQVAKADLSRWKTIPIENVTHVKHVDNSNSFGVTYLNDKGKSATQEMSVKEKSNRNSMLESLKNALPHLQHRTTPATVKDLIFGHLIALFFVSVIGAVLIGASFMDPESASSRDDSSGRRKGRALTAIITYVAGLLGPVGCISLSAIAVGYVGYAMVNDLKHPPTKHELVQNEDA